MYCYTRDVLYTCNDVEVSALDSTRGALDGLPALIMRAQRQRATATRGRSRHPNESPAHGALKSFGEHTAPRGNDGRRGEVERRFRAHPQVGEAACRPDRDRRTPATTQCGECFSPGKGAARAGLAAGLACRTWCVARGMGAHQSHGFGQSRFATPMYTPDARPAANQARAMTVLPTMRTAKTLA